MPFVNLEARTDSHMSVCCQMDDLIASDREPDKPMSLMDSTLSDGWNSKWLRDVRAEFLSGGKPKSCYSCWTAEDAGLESKRQRALKDFPDALFDALSGNPQKKPIAMDMKLGNICNNKCRICTSYASSLWVPEEKERDGERNQFWNSMRINGRWPEKNSEFWTDFAEMGTDLQVLEFYGGEPLLINDHYDILETLIAEGRSKDITLMYNTNGSIYPDKGVELWPHFKRVLLSFSIDGVGKHFEYIRHPAKWDTVTENLRKLQAANIPTLRLDICYTVSIFNIYYMDEILQWRDQDFPDIPIYFNHVYTPEHISCKVLPPGVKECITEKFGDHEYHDIKATAKYCTDVDYAPDKINIFYSQTLFSDRYRKENFKETFPEFYNVLRQHGGAPENWNGV